MLRWMLRVDNWLDVAPLENMEEDHSFLFLKRNLMKIFFFLKNLEILNFLKELKFLNFFFFWKQPRKYEPNAPSPKAFLKISFFFFSLSFFLKDLERIDFFFFFLNMKICSLSKSEEDEDEDEDENGVKVMKIYSWRFFFFWKTYHLNENNFGWKLMQIAG